MKLIDRNILDSLTARAKESQRKRAHFNLHPDLADPVQRLCIAMEPETYVRPHRHSDPETWEVLLVMKGSLVLNIFDNNGKVLERTVLKAQGPVWALEFPKNTWHAPTSLESGTIVLEIKQGPYKPVPEMHSAPWAPPESHPKTAIFLEWFRNARIGDMPPFTL